MNKRAIYVGTTPAQRIGPRDSTLYLGFGMTGTIVFHNADGCGRFLSDDGCEWCVDIDNLYFPRA